MQLSHVISDLVLSAAGWAVLVGFIAKLPMRLAVLWAAFILPVALAALFGALRFAGVHESMAEISKLFQQAAQTLGSCGLMLGSYGLIAREPLQKLSVFLFVSLGILLFAMVAWADVRSVSALMPLVAMATVTISGICGWIMGKRRLSTNLLLAVAFSAIAVWSISNLPSEWMRIDAYHYLLAASLVCFGLAAHSRSISEQSTEI